MRREDSGQALIEWALLLPLYGSLALAIFAYGQWFVIRHQLIAATREAAFLYSSGRLTSQQTKDIVRKSLSNGLPALQIPSSAIYVGQYRGSGAWMSRLDEVRITYPATKQMQRFLIKEMTEKCVIQHAPPYWQTDIPGVGLGPPVSW